MAYDNPRYIAEYAEDNPAEYPGSPYDRGRAMISSIGSFWENTFADSAKLQSLFQGQALAAAASYQKFLEGLACSSRFEVPVFARSNWHYILMRETEMETELLRYGRGGLYGAGYEYGIRAASDRYTLSKPDGLSEVEFAFNRIIDPSLTLTSGVDFEIEDDLLVFIANPFDNDLVPKRNVMGDGGQVIDREAGLWLYGAGFDLEYIWQHWGYALGVHMESSTYYRDFINALADAYVLGPALKSIEGLLQAMTGIPLVSEPTETVEVVLESQDKTVVVTDANTYGYKPGVNVLVSEGDVVHGGDSLVDSLRVVEIFGNTPEPGVFPAMACGANFLVDGYDSEIVFKNESTPLNYLGVDAQGRAVVEFEVSGYAEDVQTFWARVHERGVAGGKTFAEYLDTRENPSGQPVPEYLPSEINPLDFVLQNFMGNNLCFIRMKIDDFAPGAPGIGWFRALRRVMTPHTTCIVYVEISPEDEYIELSAGEEDIELLDMNDVEDELDEDVVFEAILLVEVIDCE